MREKAVLVGVIDTHLHPRTVGEWNPHEENGFLLCVE